MGGNSVQDSMLPPHSLCDAKCISYVLISSLVNGLTNDIHAVLGPAGNKSNITDFTFIYLPLHR